MSAIRAAIAVLVMNPGIQKRAQAEIDTVIGRDRIPTLNDREFLPYIEAIRREAIRWHVVTPLGSSRATSYDDTYDGYFIPKGNGARVSYDSGGFT